MVTGITLDCCIKRYGATLRKGDERVARSSPYTHYPWWVSTARAGAVFVRISARNELSPSSIARAATTASSMTLRCYSQIDRAGFFESDIGPASISHTIHNDSVCTVGGSGCLGVLVVFRYCRLAHTIDLLHCSVWNTSQVLLLQ